MSIFILYSRQDIRSFYVAPQEALHGQDELMSLNEQYWSTLRSCLFTIGPLFLLLILILYVASGATNSQMIASIGLVYVFVFMIIMGSYYCATLPFILISNMISRILFPNGKSAKKDMIRIVLLVLGIVGVVTYCKYGNTLFKI